MPAGSSDRKARLFSGRVAGHALAAVATYVALSVLLSWPLVANLDTHVIGDIDHPGTKGDLFFQYGLQRQMAEGTVPGLGRTDLLLYPEGMDLDPHVVFSLHQGLNVVLMTIFGLLASHNLAALLILVANALSMHALAWQRTRRISFALLSGFLFGLGPYVFLKVQQGFIQKALLFPIPLFVLFLLLGIERGRRRDLLLCGFCWVLTLMVYPPYAVFNAAFGTLLVSWYAVSQRQVRAQLRTFLPLGLAMLAMFVAVAWMLSGGPRTSALDMDRATFQMLGGFLDPLHPFRWFPYERTFMSPPAAIIPGLPLGVPVTVSLLALLAAVVGTRHSRALVCAAVVMLVVMLGPYLRLDFDPGSPERLLGPLPYYVLGKLPMGSVLKFPIRLYPWVLVAILLAAGSVLPALEALIRARLRNGNVVAMGLCPILLGIGVAESRLVFPEYARFRISEVKPPSFAEQLYTADGQALLFLPDDPLYPNDYLYYAVVTRRPLLNGYMDIPMSISVPTAGSAPSEQQSFIEQVLARDTRHIVVDLQFCGGQGPHGGGSRAGAETCLEKYGWLERLCGSSRVYPRERMAVFTVPEGGVISE